MSNKLYLHNMRCYYPDVFSPSKYDGKYACSFLIPKTDKATLNKIESCIKIGLTRANLTKLPADANQVLTEGKLIEVEGEDFTNFYRFKAKTTKRPDVKHNDANGRIPLKAEDGVIYSGCYLNGIIDADFVYYNKVSKGFFVNLLGVQFCRNGRIITRSSGCSDEDFDNFPQIDDDGNPSKISPLNDSVDDL